MAQGGAYPGFSSRKPFLLPTRAKICFRPLNFPFSVSQNMLQCPLKLSCYNTISPFSINQRLMSVILYIQPSWLKHACPDQPQSSFCAIDVFPRLPQVLSPSHANNDTIYLFHSPSISLITWDYLSENLKTSQRLQSWKSTMIIMNKKQVNLSALTIRLNGGMALVW